MTEDADDFDIVDEADFDEVLVCDVVRLRERVKDCDLVDSCDAVRELDVVIVDDCVIVCFCEVELVKVLDGLVDGVCICDDVKA